VPRRTKGEGEEFLAAKIERRAVIQAAGDQAKRIEELVGLLNSKTFQVSIARMQSPSRWVEPGQSPDFDEYTFLLRVMLQAETKTTVYEISS
jgi:hypothetical protein